MYFVGAVFRNRQNVPTGFPQYLRALVRTSPSNRQHSALSAHTHSTMSLHNRKINHAHSASHYNDKVMDSKNSVSTFHCIVKASGIPQKTVSHSIVPVI
jgi:hypothetical protein